MIIDWVIYYTVPGNFIIYDPSLSYMKILKIKREGRVQYLTAGLASPSIDEVFHNNPTGELVFSRDTPFLDGEKVYVLKKIP